MANARRKILCIEDDRETAALIAEQLAGRALMVLTGIPFAAGGILALYFTA